MFFSLVKKYHGLLILIVIFSLCYTILSVVRHNHYNSFGYDLGIIDQIVWKYSQLKIPLSTIDDTPYSLSLYNHVEFIFIGLAPFYWLWNSVYTLLVLQVLIFVTSIIPLYFLGLKYKIHRFLLYILLIGYLSFFGVQNALWFDVHSSVFGTAFLMWFIYFCDAQKLRSTAFVFLLTIFSKENFAVFTFLIAVLNLRLYQKKSAYFIIFFSLLYLFIIFGIYFRFYVPGGYHYGASTGLLSDINIKYLYDSTDKRLVWLYGLLDVGYLPVLFPESLIPVIGNLATYFILGRDVATAQGLFLQYRIDLDPLLFYACILTIAKYKWLNTSKIALYILICIFVSQYTLHLPLSYLIKKWFWTESASVRDINTVLVFIPANAAVVSQNNITPHLSHRDDIFTLWIYAKKFQKNSPCGKTECYWPSWGGKPKYLIIDTSSDWDTRHFLVDRRIFVEGIRNFEKAGNIKKFHQSHTAIVYSIVKQP